MPMDEELVTGFILELAGQWWSWLISGWPGLVDSWWLWLFMAWTGGALQALLRDGRQGARRHERRVRAKRTRKARKARQRRLLGRLRRLPEADQIRIMNWLDNRFGKGGCG